MDLVQDTEQRPYKQATFNNPIRLWNTPKTSDICIVKEPNLSHKELIIKDHGVINAYQCTDPSHLDMHFNSLEIGLFCTKQGRISLHASFIPHPLELGTSEAIFLAFPKDKWNIRLMAEASTDFYFIRMEVATLHRMINPAFNDQHLDSAKRMNMRDLMRHLPVNPSLMFCFEQLFHHKLKSPFNHLFERAKFLEIFSSLLESAFGQPMEACPVAMSPVIESKLQAVRRHIIDHLDEAPDPDKLAMLYELPRNTLREGYRYVYGKTIHQYHSDHKLESAMQLLNEGELLVKEIAFKIGYQNPSHFISAFKKKFGYTPKQYLKKDAVAAH